VAIGDRDLIVQYEDGTPVIMCDEVTMADFIRNIYLQWNRNELAPGDTIVTNIMIHNVLHSVELKITSLSEHGCQRMQ
jgi:hypothetical protein